MEFSRSTSSTRQTAGFRRTRFLTWVFIVLFLTVGTGAYFWYQSYAGVTVNDPDVTNDTLTSGLVGHWTFDGTDMDWSASGAEVLDQTASSNEADIDQAHVASVVGKLGQALHLDGVAWNDISLNSATNLEMGTGDMTISGWMDISAAVYQIFLFRKGGEGDEGYSAYFSEDFDALGVNVDTGAATTYYSADYSSSDILGTGWHYYTFVIDRDAGVSFYFDGAFLTKDGTSVYNGIDITNTGEYGSIIAGDGNGGDIGSLDDVRIYNRALSSAEVYELYTMGQVEVNAPVEEPLKQGMAGYWKMDEGTGTSTTADSSGNGNTLTMTNMESGDWQTGHVGPFTLDFDGSNEYLTIASPSSVLDFADGASFSLTGWFSRDTFANDHTMLSTKSGQSTESDGYIIWIDGGDDAIHFRADENGSTDARSIVSDSTFTSSGWNHVAVTWEDDRDVALYVNGAPEGSASGTAMASMGNLANANAFRIGAETDAGLPFDGQLDDIRVYNYALSGENVKKLYHTSAPAESVDTSLVGHWTFDGPDIQGATAIDRSGLGNNGTITGAVPAIGKLGQALSFNGTGDYINASSGSSLANLSALTISFWMDLASFGQNGQGNVINKGSDCCDPVEGFLVKVSGIYNFVEFGVDYDGATDLSMSSVDNSLTSSDFGVWTHIVVTWTGSSTATSAIIYKNGQNMTQSSGDNGDGNRRDDSGSSFHIGVDAGWPISRAFDGKLDDVRIYNRVLSASEVLALYNQGR